MEACKRFIKEQIWSLIALAAAVLLLIICGILFSQKGIHYKDSFLRKQADGCWQGRVMGEVLSITRSRRHGNRNAGVSGDWGTGLG